MEIDIDLHIWLQTDTFPIIFPRSEISPDTALCSSNFLKCFRGAAVCHFWNLSTCLSRIAWAGKTRQYFGGGLDFIAVKSDVPGHLPKEIHPHEFYQTLRSRDPSSAGQIDCSMRNEHMSRDVDRQSWDTELTDYRRSLWTFFWGRDSCCSHVSARLVLRWSLSVCVITPVAPCNLFFFFKLSVRPQRVPGPRNPHQRSPLRRQFPARQLHFRGVRGRFHQNPRKRDHFLSAGEGKSHVERTHP